MRIRIGTSGWHYRHWHGVHFPETLPPRDWLGFHARHFDTVEVNSSFYRVPTAPAVSTWVRATPEDFVFSVKASRFITHVKKLLEPDRTTPAFLSALPGFGSKLGPVLFQLPPRFPCDPPRLAAFLATWPGTLRCAFEFRDPDWHREEVFDLLRRFGAAFCIFDLGGFTSPAIATTNFAYLRLHGPANPYCGLYGDERLGEWAERIRALGKLEAVYVYFDNDQAGRAVADALALKAMLGMKRGQAFA
jgi:uncharacterized protein YecE (DUF72 family)